MLSDVLTLRLNLDMFPHYFDGCVKCVVFIGTNFFVFALLCVRLSAAKLDTFYISASPQGEACCTLEH